MDPATRVALLLALLAIALSGVGLIVMVILGARMVRRWSRFTPPPARVMKPKPPPPPDFETEADDDADTGQTTD